MGRLFGVALAAGLLCGAAQAQNIGGNYTVTGTNLDGSPYRGTARIFLTSSTTCEIEWTTGSTTSAGICSRNDDAFAAGYVLGNAIGLVIYKVRPNGVLDGIWTVAGAEGAGTETLTPR